MIKSYLEDALPTGAGSCEGDTSNLTGKPTQGGLTEFSGSYGTDECLQGMLGGAEYYRAFRESELARMAPDVLARSIKSTWDEPFLSVITPEKPAAVSLAGYDVFGPQSFSTSTRNMTTDLRGEAAYVPNLTGEMPTGASASSYAMGSALNFSDCATGCGCPKEPARSTTYGSSDTLEQRCMRNCTDTAVSDGERAICLEKCGSDAPFSYFNSNDDAFQQCAINCVANGGTPSDVRSCVGVCRSSFNGGRGASVRDVFPAEKTALYTPSRVQGVTVLRPYHV